MDVLDDVVALFDQAVSARESRAKTKTDAELIERAEQGGARQLLMTPPCTASTKQWSRVTSACRQDLPAVHQASALSGGITRRPRSARWRMYSVGDRYTIRTQRVRPRIDQSTLLPPDGQPPAVNAVIRRT